MDKQPKMHDKGYYPKSGDELKFYLKHLIKKLKLYKPAENDKQFDGGTKPIDRHKDRHGYMPGEDVAVYENVFHDDPVKKKRMQGKDWHSKPAMTKSMTADETKHAVKAHMDEYKKDPGKYARKMSEESIEEGIKPYVSHSGTTASVMDSQGNVAASYSKKEHGEDYHKKAESHLRSNYDDLNKKKPSISDILNKPSNKYLKSRHPGIKEAVDHVMTDSGPVAKSGKKKFHKDEYGQQNYHDAAKKHHRLKEEMKNINEVLGVETVHDLISEERKVSSGATKAFLNREKFKSKNTHVHDDDGVHVMKLHGNLIARHHSDGKIEVTHAGWGTKTTKERTSSIARAVGADQFSTRKHQLHHGDKPIDDDQWVTLRDNK